MINYSLSKRAVDPSKQDGEKRVYPNAQTVKVMSLDEFANHISKHNCPYHRSDINAVLTRSVDCVREMLLEGNKVCLGELGNFYVRLEAKGAMSVEKFNPASDITAVKVYWKPGLLFRDLITDAEFQNVATRKAQDNALKAERAGLPDGGSDNPGGGSGTDNTGGSSDNTGGGDNTGGSGDDAFVDGDDDSGV